jgi:hypothetical protein
MISLLKFIKIYQLVQKLLGRTQTDRQTGDLISLTFLFKEIRLIIHGSGNIITGYDTMNVTKKRIRSLRINVV